jgi:outer membrane protein
MRTTILLSLFAFTGYISAQDSSITYDLATCIRLATQNSLDAKQAGLTTESSALGYKQAKSNLLPDLSASGGQFYQAGRTIDRFTNTFSQTTISSNNFSASSSAVLFAGGQLRNNIQAGKYTWLASEYDQQFTEQNIALSVANLFLQLAQVREQILMAEKNLSNTQLQLDRAQRQFDAGAVNEGVVLGLKAQAASDQLAVQQARNQEMANLTSLKLVMRLPHEQQLFVVLPKIAGASEPYPLSMDVLFDSAVNRRPDVQAAEFRQAAAKYRVKSAKGQYLPSLSVGGSISTVYSSSAQEVTAANIKGFQPIGRVQGSNEIVEAPSIDYTLQTINFADQVKNNFGQSLGFNLNIPVFNKFQTANNVRQAEINEEISSLNAERTVQNLYNEITTAYNSYDAARLRYVSAQEAMKAQTLNLEYVTKRYDAGAASLTELQLARGAEATASNTRISALYEMVFRRLVLDFYAGESLTL